MDIDDLTIDEIYDLEMEHPPLVGSRMNVFLDPEHERLLHPPEMIAAQNRRIEEQKLLIEEQKRLIHEQTRLIEEKSNLIAQQIQLVMQGRELANLERQARER